MSKVYMVSYDLNKLGQDYEGLYEELRRSSGYWHYLDSTWLISTSESANSIFNRLRPSIDNNDSVLIIDVGRDYSGWLSKKAWEWIKQQIG